jgi:hypothetical protein
MPQADSKVYGMPHFLVLYYMAVIMLGLAALAISVVGTIRSRVTSYWLLILFYGAFTASIAALLVREYLYVNIAGFYQYVTWCNEPSRVSHESAISGMNNVQEKGCTPKLQKEFLRRRVGKFVTAG